jgi:hypothetical protein
MRAACRLFEYFVASEITEQVWMKYDFLNLHQKLLRKFLVRVGQIQCLHLRLSVQKFLKDSAHRPDDGGSKHL